MKVCLDCKEEKDFINFTKDSSKKDKLNNYCRDCNKKRKNKWDSENKDRNREYNIRYNKEERIFDKEKIREYKKEYYIRNKSNISNRVKVFRSENREYLHERRMSNIELRLKEKIGNGIRAMLKKNGYTKSNRTTDILGCSVDEFKLYLESKFETWMSWENCGKYNGEINYGWDIDHIIPLSSAKTEEEIIKLNHYTNLQPLCSYINRYIKCDKLDFYKSL